MSEAKLQRPRFKPGEVIISPVTEADLVSLAEGYHAAFPATWFDKTEPPHLRLPDTVRARNFAARMVPWLRSPHTKWSKVTLASDPSRVIGHAGWLAPERTRGETVNFWRRDAGELLGWSEMMGWAEGVEEKLWSGVDVEEWQGNFLKWDRIRGERMAGEGHWLLAPLWVVPEYQGCGISSLLLKEIIEIADNHEPSPPMYLEAMPTARPIYERFGWRGVEGEGSEFVMIRRGPWEGVNREKKEGNGAEL
ncbi:acyl-CoA N-acyltransferase [Glonium stellatum]|uniref:Acyl-CoA N-acyltransferase n=1 Tax=Glonium stellatum TaxID=574774 RepID=A0A8E2EZS6_9PEZI|nr:acyl-CoA N-acyltransferase [Glonium stellatum]